MMAVIVLQSELSTATIASWPVARPSARHR
jgi:hypothetical protein